jgi:hypothetical protein
MVFIAILLSTMAVIYVAASVFLPAAKGKTQAKRRETVPTSVIMSREEALAVLGLTPAASKRDVRAAYLDIMKKVHPDHGGGNDWMAAKVNLARTVLLKPRP